MLKKMLSVLLAVAVCLGISGCFGGNKDYEAVKKCQEAVRGLSSGRVIVTSTSKAKKTEIVVTEFTYKLTATGTYEYCQTQYDNNNKAVYCEYSDGEKAEQWLIGSGWCVIDPTVYTKENPHRYIRLLSTVCDSKAVERIEVNEQGSGKCYTIILKPDIMNDTVYEDEEDEVKEETITITTDSEDNLVYYADAATFLNQATQQERELLLEMELSEQDAVNSILKPELRDYSAGGAK